MKFLSDEQLAELLPAETSSFAVTGADADRVERRISAGAAERPADARSRRGSRR